MTTQPISDQLKSLANKFVQPFCQEEFLRELNKIVIESRITPEESEKVKDIAKSIILRWGFSEGLLIQDIAKQVATEVAAAVTAKMQKRIDQLENRLQISPHGDDKIDELEECIRNLRHHTVSLLATERVKVNDLEQENTELEKSMKLAEESFIFIRDGMTMPTIQGTHSNELVALCQQVWWSAQAKAKEWLSSRRPTNPVEGKEQSETR